MKKEIYFWLSTIKEMNYIIYIRLMRVFESVEILYRCSFHSTLFESYLKTHQIFLSKSLLVSLTSDIQKKISKNLFYNLSLYSIEVITIESVHYPENLKNIYMPPLILCYMGDISLLKKEYQKWYFPCHDFFSSQTKKQYTYFDTYLSQKEEVVKIEIATIDNLMEKEAKIYHKIVILKNSNIFSYSIEYWNKKQLSIQKKNGILIFLFSNLVGQYEAQEILAGLTDYYFVLQEKEDFTSHLLIQQLLEYGKEILTVPHSIFEKSFYFTNKLIQDGASVVLKLQDLDKEKIKKKI